MAPSCPYSSFLSFCLGQNPTFFMIAACALHPRYHADRTLQRSVQQLIESLETHRVNTLTELCRIERVAATCENEEDAVAFQGPMTAAWDYYVNSNQLLSELRGMTRSYPICSDILYDAHVRVRSDPNSNKSWNLAWLCLTKIQEEYVDLARTHASR